ncbi:uncharacterized protein ALTATR162_LOCUS908 [Alternaria atra]|uniref:Uncharacterized protein n=1 Tax=Alternaria atra TaxID=119953 RepID=A0A8J2HUU2_9PLEO|nr:uncharacterized protein ALTATR162_LOCUS908 [Alternaria atra]CAG5141301.1 unnamed protein product [Alternaria atra]
MNVFLKKPTGWKSDGSYLRRSANGQIKVIRPEADSTKKSTTSQGTKSDADHSSKEAKEKRNKDLMTTKAGLKYLSFKTGGSLTAKSKVFDGVGRIVDGRR